MTHTTPPVIIGLAGYAGTNKELVATRLAQGVGDHPPFTWRTVTDIVARIAAGALGWDGTKDGPGRAKLWDASRRYRAAFGPNALIADALRDTPARLVISGVRLEVEANAIRAAGGVVITLTRPNVIAADDDEALLCVGDITVDSSDVTTAAHTALNFALAHVAHATSPRLEPHPQPSR